MAACPPFAYPTLERALGKDFELVPVNNLADAQALLERNRDWAMVICGVYFDESRMYELLDYARTRFPALPFLCARILKTELSLISLKAIELAARTHGAGAFINFPALVAEHGDQAAHEALRQKVIAFMRGRESSRPADQFPQQFPNVLRTEGGD